jgi:hypothetical protein
LLQIENRQQFFDTHAVMSRDPLANAGEIPSLERVMGRDHFVVLAVALCTRMCEPLCRVCW